MADLVYHKTRGHGLQMLHNKQPEFQLATAAAAVWLDMNCSNAA
jgi:hypothetical protein